MTDSRVVLYSLRECPHCQAACEFLRARGVAFVERDVREEGDAIRDLTKLTGESIVPTVVVGGDVQVGWDAARVAEMLDHPLPPEEEDNLLAVIEEATRLDLASTALTSSTLSTTVPAPSGTAVVSAEVPVGVSRKGEDCTSPAE
jgi:glutaredoxin 3